MDPGLKKFPLEKRVAILLDFDLTITEEFQQMPLFRDSFENIKEHYDGRVINNHKIKIRSPIDYFTLSNAWGTPHDGLGYLFQILYDVRNGILPPLTKRDLHNYGSQIKLSPGIPKFFTDLKEEFKEEAYIGFYIVSAGIKEIIEGSSIAPYVNGIYASEFASLKAVLGGYTSDELKAQLAKYGLSEDSDYDIEEIMPIDSLKQLIRPFSKTASVIEIAKGDPKKRDELLPAAEFQIPYSNMIYIGDGTSDISSFAYLKKKGSLTVCVYKDKDRNSFQKAFGDPKIMARIDALLPRNYKKNNPLWNVLTDIISKRLNKNCKFPPLVVDLYRKRKIPRVKENTKLIKCIEDHVRKCPECDSTYSTLWVPPQ